MAAAALLLAASCNRPSAEIKLIELDSLENTKWYSLDQKNAIFYDIFYYDNGEGVMLGYDSEERENEVVNQPFSYTFSPANAQRDAIVMVNFEDGKRYGGAVIPKGLYQINYIDVFIIQLYEVDAEGEILYDSLGNFLSTLRMWNDEPQITE